MFTLIGLFFLTVKIVILATGYATITFLILLTLARTSKITWFKKVMQFKLITWFTTGFLCTVLLFFYAFSYWGYSGLGDYFCIPAGYGYVVSSIDAQEDSYFEPDNSGRQVFINNFIIKDRKVYGEFLGYNSTDCSNCFVVWDTKTGAITEFHSTGEYAAFATATGSPLANNFKNFNSNYRSYWSGPKIWFLP